MPELPSRTDPKIVVSGGGIINMKGSDNEL